MAVKDNIVSILKSTVVGRRPATNIKLAGQPYVNYADMQFGVMDIRGVHQDLLPIRKWTSKAQYTVKDMVTYNGNLYTCKVANHDTAWTLAHWKTNTTSSSVRVQWSHVTHKPATFPFASSQFRTELHKYWAGIQNNGIAVEGSVKDLNDDMYRKTGVWFIRSNTANKPANGHGVLMTLAVFSAGYGVQQYTTFDNKHFIRTMAQASTVWTSWKQIGGVDPQVAVNKTGLAAVLVKANQNASNVQKNTTAVNAIKSGFAAHIAKTTGVHGAVSTATASKIVARDVNGGAAFADIVASSMHLTMAGPPHTATGFMVQTGTTDKKLYSISAAIMKTTLGITANTAAIVVAKAAGDKGVRDAAAAKALTVTNKSVIAAHYTKIVHNSTVASGAMTKATANAIQIVKLNAQRYWAGMNVDQTIGSTAKSGALHDFNNAKYGKSGAWFMYGGAAHGPITHSGHGVLFTVSNPTYAVQMFWDTNVNTQYNRTKYNSATAWKAWKTMGEKGPAGVKGATGSRGSRGSRGAKAKVTFGTAAPSGGATGDLYIQI